MAIVIWLNVLLAHPWSEPVGTVITGLLALLVTIGFYFAWRRGKSFTPELEDEEDA